MKTSATDDHVGDKQPADDNNDQAIPPDLVLDTGSDEDTIADLVGRTERIALVVVVGMAVDLIFLPIVCLAMSYGI
ncbi:hypothetical protein [Mesorhizobium loti]|uniref:hypothetical protein n=1 Tax=Rhizobium loti TaxID=381 RepID=UPI0005399752|nr:hypothetical protein [Mesorhizobium loti]